MPATASHDLISLIDHTHELEGRVRNLQSTIEQLRTDFAEAIQRHHQELERKLQHVDSHYGLPEQSVPMRAES